MYYVVALRIQDTFYMLVLMLVFLFVDILLLRSAFLQIRYTAASTYSTLMTIFTVTFNSLIVSCVLDHHRGKGRLLSFNSYL